MCYLFSPSRIVSRGNFFLTAIHKLRHDAEQYQYLASVGALPQKGVLRMVTSLKEVSVFSLKCIDYLLAPHFWNLVLLVDAVAVDYDQVRHPTA